jgi:hypothetical protein
VAECFEVSREVTASIFRANDWCHVYCFNIRWNKDTLKVMAADLHGNFHKKSQHFITKGRMNPRKLSFEK